MSPKDFKFTLFSLSVGIVFVKKVKIDFYGLFVVYFQAQYRYAQAFFELGNVIRAKETNRAARKICSERKDLETQYERFQRGTQASKSTFCRVIECFLIEGYIIFGIRT